MQTHLSRRGNGRYYHRRRIPQDLLDHFGRKELVKSLGTSDRKEAERRTRALSTQQDIEFDQIRNSLSSMSNAITELAKDFHSDSNEAEPTISLHSAEIEQMPNSHAPSFDDLVFVEANDYLKRIKRNMLEARVMGNLADFTASERFSLANNRAVLDGLETSPYPLWKIKGMVLAQQEIFEHGKHLPIQFIETHIQKAATSEIKHHERDTKIAFKISETQPSPTNLGRNNDTPKLETVVRHFLADYDSTNAMFKKHTVTLPLLLEFIGNIPIDQLRQIKLDEFSKFVCKLPPKWAAQSRRENLTVLQISEREHPVTISEGTYKDSYISSLRSFLAFAKRNYGDMGFNSILTTDGLKYRGSRTGNPKKQRAFTSTELKTLFEGKELSEYAVDAASHHKYWLPLLGLYTGARVNEICQLNPQADIRRSEEGIWFFDFTEEGNTHKNVTRSIKNKTSIRKVPIHEQLLELGFLSYLETIKQSGSDLIFPLWKPSKGRASTSAEKWFREFLKTIGLRDETEGKTLTGMHAFRSTFLNRALNLGVTNAEFITGHASDKSSVVRGYEGELSLVNKLAILSLITFDIQPKAMGKSNKPMPENLLVT